MNRTIIIIPRKKSFLILALLCLGILWGGQASLSFSQEGIPGKDEDVLLPYTLIGVVVSKDAKSSVAVFKNNETGDVVRLSAGERILGMEIIQIVDDGILFKKGEKIYWNLLKESVPKSTAKPALQLPEKDEIPGQERLLPINNEAAVTLPEKEYNRADIEKKVERERLLILKEMSVIPNYVDGKIAGFKVIKLPKTGVASEVGIYEGDVVKEVNGVELDSLSSVIGFYGKIYTEDRFEFLIERNGKLVRQVYILR
jgi:general secretion pathway protein C